jgi:TetR/AcrR family transcriptional repressor of mexJK operon
MNSEATDTTDRRRQILEAAVRVFSTKGFHKATNKDIADEAGGISPGLIYHYFKDKHDLFLSIFHERVPLIELSSHPEELMERPPEEVLTMFGSAYLSVMNSPGNVALFRIMIGEAFRFPQIAEVVYRVAISRIFGTLTRYLEYQVKLGHLRPHDSQIAIRSFMGSFMAHLLLREVFHQPEAIAADPQAVVSEVVTIFLRGLAPDQASPPE